VGRRQPRLPQIEFLHLVSQGIARDTQQAGGLRLIAISFLERAHQQAALVVLERHSVGQRRHRGGRSRSGDSPRPFLGFSQRYKDRKERNTWQGLSQIAVAPQAAHEKGMCYSLPVMPFSKDQEEKITQALGTKITNPCPSCNLHQRQLLPDLVLFPLYSGPAESVVNFFANIARAKERAQEKMPPQLVNALKLQPPTPPSAPFLPTSTALPSVVVICGNCGFTEFYNVHALGVTDVLGIYSKVVPHGK
jgi:hypothetical protein